MVQLSMYNYATIVFILSDDTVQLQRPWVFNLDAIFNGQNIIVTFTAKSDEELPDTIALDFENALLSQTVRLQVYKQTHVIREVLMARAMSSTMTMDNDPVGLVEDNYLDDNIDNILKDWFVNEGKDI